jgi:CubicO group peptidase (beta-lactamase class C family)
MRISGFRRALGGVLIGLVLLTACSPAPSTTTSSPSGPQPTPLPSVTPIPAAGSVGTLQPIGSEPTNRPIGAAVASTDALLADLRQRAQAMDAHLSGLAAMGSFNGAVLAAAGSQVLIAHGYGQANREGNLPATRETRFRLASLTKPMTATAIWQLHAAGKIDINASVCRYLADCPAAWQPITIRHLLSHTAGLPNYTDFASFPSVEQLPATPQSLLERFRGLPLGFTPGSGYQYTNSGYVVLGRVIEAVSGQSYAEYLQSAIFEPAGMLNSGVDSGDGSALNGTVGYLNSGPQRAIPINTSNLDSAGAVYSTVEDLYRFVHALHRGLLMPPDVLEQMFTPSGVGTSTYAMGWLVTEVAGRRVVYHPGFISGAVTHLAWYPDDGSTMVVLSNQENVNADGIATYLETLLPPPMPQP